MSTEKNRRQFLALTGLGIGAGLNAGPALAQITGPAGAAIEYAAYAALAPATLSRTMIRELPGNASLRVTRSWSISFEPIVDGAIVRGELLDVAVDAPANLQALAQIEKQRRGNAPFPLRLDRQGLIAGTSTAMQDAMVDEAVTEAQSILDAARLQASDQAQARLFLANMQRGGAEILSKLPADLLFPQRTEWRSDRVIDLPNGQTGRFLIECSADAATDNPLLARTQRRITTAIGSDTRTTNEIWHLVPGKA